MATTAGSKGKHEEFARFFEQPTREALRNLLQRHFGELNELDFKEVWPAHAKLARHLLGIANSHGGCLIIGVAQQDDNSLHPVGLATLADKADIHKGVKRFIPEQLIYEVLDFPFAESEYPTIKGKKFQVVIVEDTPKYIPFVAMADGEGICNAAIYTRRGTSTEEATYHELQEMFNRRLETEYSSHQELALEEHLATLKSLYEQIDPYRQREWRAGAMAVFYLLEYEQNPTYPKESFDEFIVRMIALKKNQIEELFKG